MTKINNIIKERRWFNFNFEDWQNDDYRFFSVFYRFCIIAEDNNDIISYFFTIPQLNNKLMSINPSKIPDLSWDLTSEFWTNITIGLIEKNSKKEYIKIALINSKKFKENLENLPMHKKYKILYYLYDNFINESSISESLNEFERRLDSKSVLNLEISKK